MRNWAVPIALGAILGCAPKGNPPAVPASLQPGSAAVSLGENEEKTVIPAEESFRQGLPSFCEVHRQADRGCLVCRVGELPLERCFEQTAEFDPQKTCTYDKNQLKCLVTENLTVVKVSFANSPEKQVLDDLPVILSNIKAIVQHGETKEQEEMTRLFALLDFVNANSRAILLGQHPHELAAQLTRTMASHSKGMDAKSIENLEQSFLAGVQRLRNETTQGQLDDGDGLQFVRDIALLFVRSEQTVRMLKTMNVDGLNGTRG